MTRHIPLGALVFTMKGPKKFANILIAHTLAGYKFAKLSRSEPTLARLIAHLVLDAGERKTLGLGAVPLVHEHSQADTHAHALAAMATSTVADSLKGELDVAAAATDDGFGFDALDNAVYEQKNHFLFPTIPFFSSPPPRAYLFFSFFPSFPPAFWGLTTRRRRRGGIHC